MSNESIVKMKSPKPYFVVFACLAALCRANAQPHKVEPYFTSKEMPEMTRHMSNIEKRWQT